MAVPLPLALNGALGTEGDIIFNGGTLAYANSAAGEDATGYDISSRVNVGDGGFLNVSVLGAGDTVSWAGLSADVMGAGTTLTKTGAGTLALGYAGNTLAHLTVEEGTLAFTGGATIGVNPNNATIVRVSEGASLALSGGTVNLHAQLNGAGTVTIGTADMLRDWSISPIRAIPTSLAAWNWLRQRGEYEYQCQLGSLWGRKYAGRRHRFH